MKRNAFAMRLKPGCEKEYKKRHDAIWPELKAELRKAGVSDYSIYLDRKTNTLFAFQYIPYIHTVQYVLNEKRWKKPGPR